MRYINIGFDLSCHYYNNHRNLIINLIMIILYCKILYIFNLNLNLLIYKYELNLNTSYIIIMRRILTLNTRSTMREYAYT